MALTGSSAPKKILVLHGVEVSGDKDQNQHKQIEGLVLSRLAGLPIPFSTEMFRYADINNLALEKYNKLAGLILDVLLKQLPLVGVVAKKAAEDVLRLVGDVVLETKNTSTAKQIKKALKKKILEEFEQGNSLYVVAHSLGSVYAYAVINELIQEDDLFANSSRKSWPVQGLVTIGSPLSLPMFTTRVANPITDPDAARHAFRWKNFRDSADPVTTGSWWGDPNAVYAGVEQYKTEGWFINDIRIDTGKVWLMAHTAYWSNSAVGDAIMEMLAN